LDWVLGFLNRFRVFRILERSGFGNRGINPSNQAQVRAEYGQSIDSNASRKSNIHQAARLRILDFRIDFLPTPAMLTYLHLHQKPDSRKLFKTTATPSTHACDANPDVSWASLVICAFWSCAF
jgi:hypothetical protein